MKNFSRRTAYQPVRRAAPVPKKPVFPSYKSGVNAGPVFFGYCVGGPYAGQKLMIRGLSIDFATMVFSAGGMRGRYALYGSTFMWQPVS